MRFFVFFFDFSLVFIYISLIASWLLLFQGLIHDYIDQAFSPLKPLLTSKPEAHGYKQLCLTALRTDPSFQSELERKGEMKERPRGGGENHGPPWCSQRSWGVQGRRRGVQKGCRGAPVSSNLSPHIEHWHTHTQTHVQAPLVLHDGPWQLCAQAGASKSSGFSENAPQKKGKT